MNILHIFPLGIDQRLIDFIPVSSTMASIQNNFYQ